MFRSFIKHLILFLIPHLLFASNQFEKKIQFGNPSKCQRVIYLQDSSYLLTGFVEGAVQSSILCKINSVGDTLWSKQYAVDDYSLDAVMTNDFGFIVVGATQNDFGDQSSGVWKTDSQGNLQWSKIISPDTTAYSVFSSILKVGNNFLIGGFVDDANITSSSEWAITLVMIDSSGAILWSKMYWVDSEYYSILSMKFTSDNHILITGTSDSNYTMKLDTQGNLVWLNTYSDGMFSSIEEINGYYYFCGFNVDYECILTMTDANGNEIWTKSYNGLFEPVGLTQNYSGGLAMATSYADINSSQAAILQVDSSGIPIQLTAFSSLNDDMGADIKKVNGGFIFLAQKDVDINDATVLISSDSLMQSGCELTLAIPNYLNIPIQQSTVTPQMLVTFYSEVRNQITGSGVIVTNICSTSSIKETANTSPIEVEISKYKLVAKNVETSSLKIYNMFGEVVREFTFDKDIQINLSDLHSGIYLYNIFSRYHSKTGKLILVN